MGYAYLDSDSTYADTLNPAFTIYGEICKIMMESKMNTVVSLSDNDNSVSNSTMTVTEDDWISLGKSINDAIIFYQTS